MDTGDHLPWTSRFEVGVPELDADHREIVDGINRIGRFCDALDHGAVANALCDLYAFCLEHFAREEVIIQTIPGFAVAAHVSGHQRRAQDLVDAKQRLSAESGAYDLTALPPFLVDWFCRHAIGHDAQIRAFFFNDDPFPR